MAKDKRRAKSIRMTEEVREKYDALASEEGIDQSELIDRMIEAYRNRGTQIENGEIIKINELQNKDKTADLIMELTKKLEQYNAGVDNRVSNLKDMIKDLSKNIGSIISDDSNIQENMSMLQDIADKIDASLNKIDSRLIDRMGGESKETFDNLTHMISKVDEVLHAVSGIQPQAAQEIRKDESIGDVEMYADACYQKMLPAFRALYNGINMLQENVKDNRLSEEKTAADGIKMLRKYISDMGDGVATKTTEKILDIGESVIRMEKVIEGMPRDDASVEQNRERIMELEQACANKDKVIIIKDEYIEMLRKKVKRTPS